MAPDGEFFRDPYLPLTSEMLPVGQGHALYVETVGRGDGIPAVYLHGGPGSGCQPAHRRLFDPARMRAVLFDQRGAGRSTPARSRESNTTAHLVADLETIRQHFGIESWLVAGGSWGATLALAYAETYPERVSGLVLRAVFLGTRDELARAFGSGLAALRPELYADFLAQLPEDERGDPLAGYFRRILDADPAVHGPAALAYAQTERILSEVRPAATRLDPVAIAKGRPPFPATAFMEAHYFSHDCWLEPGQLLRDAGRLGGIPGVIVQGRYDALCPPATSSALATAWGSARVEMVEGAGHAMSDPGITEAVTAAITSLAGG